MKISDIPPFLRPREKALANGISSLSEVELLAIIIGKGIKGKNALEVASSLLFSCGSLSSLFLAPMDYLKKMDGISKVKAIEISTIGEIYKRMDLEEREDNKSEVEIVSSFKKEMKNEKRERLHIVFFSSSKKYLGSKCLYEGTALKIPISPGEIVGKVLRRGASSFIMLHNHPSGSPLPSIEDQEITALVDEAASLQSVKLKDHFIIGENGIFSIKKGVILPGEKQVNQK